MASESWRLLRALIACGFSTQGWGEIPPTARQLLERLAATLPSYRLPVASAAHSRHFMPTGSIEKGCEKTTLVFDTWANVGDGALQVYWDCELTDEQTGVLEELAHSLGYLGRSESWVEAELMASEGIPMNRLNAFPHRDGMCPGPEWEQVLLQAAVSPAEYAAWRETSMNKILAQFPLPEGKKRPSAKLLKDRATRLRPTLRMCLTVD